MSAFGPEPGDQRAVRRLRKIYQPDDIGFSVITPSGQAWLRDRFLGPRGGTLLIVNDHKARRTYFFWPGQRSVAEGIAEQAGTTALELGVPAERGTIPWESVGTAGWEA